MASAPRLLTKHASGSVPPGSLDDTDGNLVIHEGDAFSSSRSGVAYQAIDHVGSGSFGTVVKCVVVGGAADAAGAVPHAQGGGPRLRRSPHLLRPGCSVALKVVRNHPAYFSQATMEIQYLTLLNRATARVASVPLDATRAPPAGAGSSTGSDPASLAASGASAAAPAGSGLESAAAPAPPAGSASALAPLSSSTVSTHTAAPATAMHAPTMGSGSIVDLLDHFTHAGHLVLVFPFLPATLLDSVTEGGYRGLPLVTVRAVVRQVMGALHFLHSHGVCHADVKPENVMLTAPLAAAAPAAAASAGASVSQLPVDTTPAALASFTKADNSYDSWPGHSAADGGRQHTTFSPSSPSSSPSLVDAQSGAASSSSTSASGVSIKLIDFGSSCIDATMAHHYVQSRFYRAPEVMLGLPYDSAIDLWSAGCLAAELFLGLPLFPGCNEHDLVFRMTRLLGPFPEWMLETGHLSGRFFTVREREHGVYGYGKAPVGSDVHGYGARGWKELDAGPGPECDRAGERVGRAGALSDYHFRDAPHPTVVPEESGSSEPVAAEAGHVPLDASSSPSCNGGIRLPCEREDAGIGARSFRGENLQARLARVSLDSPVALSSRRHQQHSEHVRVVVDAAGPLQSFGGRHVHGRRRGVSGDVSTLPKYKKRPVPPVPAFVASVAQQSERTPGSNSQRHHGDSSVQTSSAPAAEHSRPLAVLAPDEPTQPVSQQGRPAHHSSIACHQVERGEDTAADLSPSTKPALVPAETSTTAFASAEQLALPRVVTNTLRPAREPPLHLQLLRERAQAAVGALQVATAPPAPRRLCATSPYRLKTTGEYASGVAAAAASGQGGPGASAAAVAAAGMVGKQYYPAASIAALVLRHNHETGLLPHLMETPLAPPGKDGLEEELLRRDREAVTRHVHAQRSAGDPLLQSPAVFAPHAPAAAAVDSTQAIESDTQPSQSRKSSPSPGDVASASGMMTASTMMRLPVPASAAADAEEEQAERRVFVDFLLRLLSVDPRGRMSAAQALAHPFLQPDVAHAVHAPAVAHEASQPESACAFPPPTLVPAATAHPSSSSSATANFVSPSAAVPEGSGRDATAQTLAQFVMLLEEDRLVRERRQATRRTGYGHTVRLYHHSYFQALSTSRPAPLLPLPTAPGHTAVTVQMPATSLFAGGSTAGEGWSTPHGQQQQLPSRAPHQRSTRAALHPFGAAPSSEPSGYGYVAVSNVPARSQLHAHDGSLRHPRHTPHSAYGAHAAPHSFTFATPQLVPMPHQHPMLLWQAWAEQPSQPTGTASARYAHTEAPFLSSHAGAMHSASFLPPLELSPAAVDPGLSTFSKHQALDPAIHYQQHWQQQQQQGDAHGVPFFWHAHPAQSLLTQPSPQQQHDQHISGGGSSMHGRGADISGHAIGGGGGRSRAISLDPALHGHSGVPRHLQPGETAPHFPLHRQASHGSHVAGPSIQAMFYHESGSRYGLQHAPAPGVPSLALPLPALLQAAGQNSSHRSDADQPVHFPDPLNAYTPRSGPISPPSFHASPAQRCNPVALPSALSPSYSSGPGRKRSGSEFSASGPPLSVRSSPMSTPRLTGTTGPLQSTVLSQGFNAGAVLADSMSAPAAAASTATGPGTPRLSVKSWPRSHAAAGRSRAGTHEGVPVLGPAPSLHASPYQLQQEQMQQEGRAHGLSSSSPRLGGFVPGFPGYAQASDATAAQRAHPLQQPPVMASSASPPYATSGLVPAAIIPAYFPAPQGVAHAFPPHAGLTNEQAPQSPNRQWLNASLQQQQQQQSAAASRPALLPFPVTFPTSASPIQRASVCSTADSLVSTPTARTDAGEDSPCRYICGRGNKVPGNGDSASCTAHECTANDVSGGSPRADLARVRARAASNASVRSQPTPDTLQQPYSPSSSWARSLLATPRSPGTHMQQHPVTLPFPTPSEHSAPPPLSSPVTSPSSRLPLRVLALTGFAATCASPSQSQPSLGSDGSSLLSPTASTQSLGPSSNSASDCPQAFDSSATPGTSIQDRCVTPRLISAAPIFHVACAEVHNDGLSAGLHFPGASQAPVDQHASMTRYQMQPPLSPGHVSSWQLSPSSTSAFSTDTLTDSAVGSSTGERTRAGSHSNSGTLDRSFTSGVRTTSSSFSAASAGLGDGPIAVTRLAIPSFAHEHFMDSAPNPSSYSHDTPSLPSQPYHARDSFGQAADVNTWRGPGPAAGQRPAQGDQLHSAPYDGGMQHPHQLPQGRDRRTYSLPSSMAQAHRAAAAAAIAVAYQSQQQQQQQQLWHPGGQSHRHVTPSHHGEFRGGSGAPIPLVLRTGASYAHARYVHGGYAGSHMGIPAPLSPVSTGSTASTSSSAAFPTPRFSEHDQQQQQWSRHQSPRCGGSVSTPGSPFLGGGACYYPHRHPSVSSPGSPEGGSFALPGPAPHGAMQPAAQPSPSLSSQASEFPELHFRNPDFYHGSGSGSYPASSGDIHSSSSASGIGSDRNQALLPVPPAILPVPSVRSPRSCSVSDTSSRFGTAGPVSARGDGMGDLKLGGPTSPSRPPPAWSDPRGPHPPSSSFLRPIADGLAAGAPMLLLRPIRERAEDERSAAGSPHAARSGSAVTVGSRDGSTSSSSSIAPGGSRSSYGWAVAGAAAGVHSPTGSQDTVATTTGSATTASPALRGVDGSGSPSLPMGQSTSVYSGGGADGGADTRMHWQPPAGTRGEDRGGQGQGHSESAGMRAESHGRRRVQSDAAAAIPRRP